MAKDCEGEGMNILTKRSYDYKKEHYKLDRTNNTVWCSHCGKTVEKRDSIPDYAVFMGPVWIKQNLPCKPYPVKVKEAK